MIPLISLSPPSSGLAPTVLHPEVLKRVSLLEVSGQGGRKHPDSSPLQAAAGDVVGGRGGERPLGLTWFPPRPPIL